MDRSPSLARADVTVQVESPAATVAERRAWFVLWLTFATFGVLVLSTVRFVTDYVNSADIDLSARVETNRDYVEVQRPGGPVALWTSVDRELPVGTVLAAQRSGSLRVRFFDDSRMTVAYGARVELARMDVGRFIKRQTIAVRQDAGPVRYETVGEVLVSVPHGVVRLGAGDATVWVEGGQTRVLVYAGEARLESGGSSLLIPLGKRGVLTADGRLQGPDDRAEDLLANGDFARRGEGWEQIDMQSGRDVLGERQWLAGALVQGVPVPGVLRLVRESVNQTHGETGLSQPLDMDVSGFRSLYVEALVRIDRASLSGGGQLGSEYPMILRLQYEALPQNSRPDWTVGFYYANPDDLPVRNAELIGQGEWYRFRSNNLFDQEEARRPFRLLRFEVMAQGHTYDSQVAAVRLIGD